MGILQGMVLKACDEVCGKTRVGEVKFIFFLLWSPSITDDDDFLFNIESGFSCG